MQIPILNMITEVINFCFQCFQNVFAKLYIFRDLFISVIILITIYRFLLAPLFGGGSYGKSDTAKKSKKGKGDSHE